MATYKSAIKQTREIRAMVRRAAAALEGIISQLPEAERGAALEVVRACARAELPRDMPGMPRGNYIHQEAMLDEARSAGCGEEVLHALCWHGPIEAARTALANDLPAKTWGASTATLCVWSALSSILSAQFVINCCNDGGWSPDDSKTWWPMAHHAHCQAETAIELAEMITAA